MGHDVTVFTSDLWSYSPPVKMPCSKFARKVDGITVRRFGAISTGCVEHGIDAVMPSMVPAMLKETVDVIHAHGYLYFPTYASALVRRLKKDSHVVMTTHTQRGSARHTRMIADSSLGRLVLRTADHLVALTRSEMEYLSSMGVDRQKISVIPNGIDVQRFSNMPERDEFRRKHGIAEENVLLYVGRIDAVEKGLDTIVKALPVVLQEEPSTRLVLVGPDFSGLDYLRELARKRGVERFATFIGPLFGRDLLEAYAAADLFVFPSRSEVFGIALLEAMAAGKPIVSTDVGGIPDIIEDRSNGLLVKPGSPSLLADAILVLLQDECLAGKMSTKNRATARRYDWNCIARQIEQLYISLLQK